jgi:hypothetical protein
VHALIVRQNMNTFRIASRVVSMTLCAGLVYLLYAMSVEMSGSRGGSNPIFWFCVNTAILLAVILPLAYYLWRCDWRGALQILIIVGAFAMFFMLSNFYRMLTPYLHEASSSIRLIFSLFFLISPYILPIIFYQWARKKIRPNKTLHPPAGNAPV